MVVRPPEHGPGPYDAFAARQRTAALYRSHPDLLDRTDDDGLLQVKGQDARAQIVFHEGSALFYHQFLGRDFGPDVNDSLLSALLRAAEAGRATLRLALDEQRVMPAGSFSPYLAHEALYGPPLSSAALDDPRKTGVTAFYDPKSGLTHEYPRLYADGALNGDGLKVIQIEELSDHPSAQRGEFRLLRYLHAIRDISQGTFVHCDGAIRAYTADQYQARAEKPFVTGRESASRYRKVFRVDGEIPTEVWSDIVAAWFRGNRLVGEYLQGLSTACD